MLKRFPQALLGVILLLAISAAQAETSGSLVTSSGPFVLDSQLESLIQEHIPSYHSNLLLFTQCYGGNFLDEFSDWSNTVVFASNSAGDVAYYGGFDDDAAHALFARPGRTSTQVFTAGSAGKNSKEAPVNSSGSVSLEETSSDGPIKSRHVLIYAGQPEELDELMAADITLNFEGDANTTVTTVMGNGSADGWDYPATFEGLRDALKKIGEVMNANEQFIMFVTDHGSHVDTTSSVTVPANSEVPVEITTTVPVMQEMDATTENDLSAGFLLWLESAPSELPSGDDIELIMPGSPTAFPISQGFQYDVNDDGVTSSVEGAVLFFQVPESSYINYALGGQVQFDILNNTGNSLTFDTVGLQSGAIPQAGIPDLFLEAEGNFTPDAELHLGQNDIVLGAFDLVNGSTTATVTISRSDVMIGVTGEAADHLQRLSLHQDVNADGLIGAGDDLLAETYGLGEGLWAADYVNPIDLLPGQSTSLLLGADTRNHPLAGRYAIDYSYDPAASTCVDTIPPYTVDGDFRIMGNVLEVLFPDAPEPISGELPQSGAMFTGETPFVFWNGWEVQEAWNIDFFAQSPASFSGRSEVFLREVGSTEPYCSYIYELSGQQDWFHIP